MKISLLYTTARPWLINRTAISWLTDAQDTELVVVTDTPVSNPISHQACSYIINQGPANCVAGWNLAAVHATGDILVQVSDDLTPPAGWSQLIRKWMADKPRAVFNLLDLDMATTKCHHPVVSREAYEAAGTMYPPVFESLWCDNWFHEYHSRFSDYYTSDKVFWHTRPGAINDSVKAIHSSKQRHLAGMQTFNELVAAMHGQSNVKILSI